MSEPGFTDQAERKRDAILRRMKASGGLRITCVGCGAVGRHDFERDGRLRDRRCKSCGGPARATWWIEQNPERYLAERKAWLRGHPE